MICPKCKSQRTTTTASINGLWVERYKKCKACGYNFQTCKIVKVDISLIDYQQEILRQMLKQGLIFNPKPKTIPNYRQQSKRLTAG